MSLTILDHVEAKRANVIANLHHKTKGLNGQYMTPASIAAFMAHLFEPTARSDIRLLDAGAGSGALTAAFLDRWCGCCGPSNRISVTAYETDPYLLSEFRETARVCKAQCEQAGASLTIDVMDQDFVLSGSTLLTHDLFSQSEPEYRATFTHAVLNPPYKKIHSRSKHRLALRRAGIETSNLYTAFLAIAIQLLEPGGQLVAITPRSFCNGPYFRPFRKILLGQTTLKRIHVFHSRESAFSDDDVLQENIIFCVIKGSARSPVTISSSSGREFADLSVRQVSHERVVSPNDRDLVIHIPVDKADEYVLERIAALPCSLKELGLQVSTGPVIDFRLRPHIRDTPDDGTVPLLYPAHFQGNKVRWPLANCRKPNAIDSHPSIAKWLMPNGYYVLTRRFSSKEERRRIVPALYDPAVTATRLVGFENHLNVFHRDGNGLGATLARGLTAYLSSTLVDLYFRQFSGHTQVNANDLRMLPYPDEPMLAKLAELIDPTGHCLTDEIDEFLEHALNHQAVIASPDPVQIFQRTQQVKEERPHAHAA